MRIKMFSSFLVSLFLISTAQAGIPTVTFNPPLTVGSVEHFTLSDAGTDVTSNFTIQSIAPDPVSGYTPAKASTAFRANQPGSFTITFLSNINASTFTAPANYAPAPAYVQLASGSSQSATTGTALSQPIKVLVIDANGNKLSGVGVTWSITGNSGSFSPSTSDVNGIASTTLTMGSTPGTYSITATAGSITSSDLIQATANPAAAQLSGLNISTQPSNQNEQNIIFPTQPVLSLTTGASAAYTIPTTVTAAAYNNQGCTSPASTPLSGTLSVQSNASGVATFIDLKYPNQTSFFIKFTAGTLSTCSSSLVVWPPASTATTISLASSPPSTYAKVQFSFGVKITDSSSNLIGSASNLVSISPFTDATCTTAATGTLSGASPINAYQGQATFGSLEYSKVETIYIKATATGLTSFCSSAIQVKQNPLDSPTSFTFLSVPTTEKATKLFGTQPFVYVTNGAGTTYQGPTTFPITIAAFSNSTCSTAVTGTLSGTLMVQSTANAGSASFSGLTYSAIETIYLGLSSPGLTSICSPAVSIISPNPILSSTAVTPSGVWSNPANWTPSTVPNSAQSIANLGLQPGYSNITLDISPILNQLNFNIDSGWTINPSTGKFFTFDGTTPSISSTGAGSFDINAAVAFNQDTVFNQSGTGRMKFSDNLTATNKNFTFNNSSSSAIMLTSYAQYSITGGSFNLMSGGLSIQANYPFPANGPTFNLNNAGALAPNLIGAAGSTFTNPINFSDTGTKDFTISNGTFTGALSGNITHNLKFNGAHLQTDCKGITLSGLGKAQFINASNRIPVTFNPLIDVNLGDGVTGGVGMFITTPGTFSNKINFYPYKYVGVVNNFDMDANAVSTGNVVFNPDGNSASGTTIRMGAYGNNFTFNGVISNGSTGAANVTLEIRGANITLNGANTYTSPTSIAGYGTLSLNGSINSNVTLTNDGAEGTIQGKGTINGSLTFAPNTSPTHLTPGYSSASEFLTVNGDVTMNANTKFQPLSSGTATSFLQVNGNLNLGSAAGNSVLVNGPALPHGSYIIIKFTGTRTGTLAPPTTPTGATITYIDTPGAGSVVLNIP